MATRTMTDYTHSQFYEMGCNPTCHICRATIDVGSEYDMRVILSKETGDHISTVEMMTCLNCADKSTSNDDLRKAKASLAIEEQLRKEREQERAAKPGCLVVNGIIVPGIA